MRAATAVLLPDAVHICSKSSVTQHLDVLGHDAQWRLLGCTAKALRFHMALRFLNWRSTRRTAGAPAHQLPGHWDPRAIVGRYQVSRYRHA